MTKRRVTAESRRRIKEIKSVGIKHVKVLGAGNIDDECEACVAVKNESFDVEYAPELPLPGCDLKWCKCIIIASES
ncbi:MAG: hypothetical protein WCF71_02525 [Verrucomicrobiia bacterium]